MQFPIFLTGVLAVRRMAGIPWPGFQTGGVAWFSDLSFPAIVWEPLAAPLGSSGAILPVAAAGLLFANLNQAFGGVSEGLIPSQPYTSPTRSISACGLSHIKNAELSRLAYFCTYANINAMHCSTKNKQAAHAQHIAPGPGVADGSSLPYGPAAAAGSASILGDVLVSSSAAGISTLNFMLLLFIVPYSM